MPTDTEPGQVQELDPWAALQAEVNGTSAEPEPVEQPEADAGTPDPDDDFKARVRAEIEEEVINALAEERTDSPFYKGMQKTLSKRDRQLQEAEQRRALLETELQATKDQTSGLAEAVQYLSEKFFNNLPEDERNAVVAELQSKRLERMEKQLAQRQSNPSPAPAPVTPEPDDDFEAVLRREVEEAVTSMRETAKEFGLDPNDKRLDYGKDDEKFAVRFRKLNASIRAAIKADEEAAVDEVRPKAPTTPTRTGTQGTAPDDTYGHSLLRRGADKLLADMRAATPARR